MDGFERESYLEIGGLRAQLCKSNVESRACLPGRLSGEQGFGKTLPCPLFFFSFSFLLPSHSSLFFPFFFFCFLFFENICEEEVSTCQAGPPQPTPPRAKGCHASPPLEKSWGEKGNNLASQFFLAKSLSRTSEVSGSGQHSWPTSGAPGPTLPTAIFIAQTRPSACPTP